MKRASTFTVALGKLNLILITRPVQFYSFKKAGGQYLPVVGVVVGDAIVRPGEREVDAYIHLKGGRSLIR